MAHKISFEIGLFVQVLQKIDVDWWFWLSESVVAFVEVDVVRFDVTFRGKGKGLSPEAVGLAVRVSEDVHFT